MAALEICNLSKTYPGFTLGPIDLTLTDGRVYGLLGPNGAGKTTLLGSVAAQLRHEGEVRWSGSQVIVSDWRMRERIAYVPETPALYDDLTVAQSLRFGELVYRQWHPERASEWQRRFCLQGNRKVGELSKGMRTKLALLMGISHDAELLLLDEPTAGLDPESRSEFQMHLKTLAAESGACLVVSSHLFEDAEQAADEFLVLRDGRIRFRSTVSEVGRMKIYSLPYAKVEAFSDSKGLLIARKEKQEAYVLVLDPENLPPGIEAVLEDAVARPASLREIYFALEGSRNGGNWSCLH